MSRHRVQATAREDPRVDIPTNPVDWHFSGRSFREQGIVGSIPDVAWVQTRALPCSVEEPG